MKKLFTLLTLFLSICSGAWAADVLYCVIEGNSATISYGEKPSGAWSYNPTYEGGVWDSFSYFLNNCKTVTSVTIDSSCQSYSGASLRKFFAGWNALEVINGIDNLASTNVTNMNSMFSGCYKLTSLDLTSLNTRKVTNMGFMFDTCNELESINVNTWDTGNVTNMFQMFSNCTALTFLDFSSFNTEKVTDMYSMFAYCSSLKTVIVGSGWNTDNVANHGSMLYGCTSLVGGDGTTFDSNYTDKTKAYAGEGGYLTSYAQIFNYTVSGDEVTITGFASGFDVPENNDLVIPNEIEGKPVTKIGSDPYNFDGAFGGNSKLKSIVIGSNVQTIDNKSFQYCTNVTDITLSESLITIGEQAFTGCAKLKDLNIPDEVTLIGSQAFAYCGTLDRVCIGRNVSVIGNHAFAQCSKLTDVVISNESQLANIGTYAFSDCSLLTSITIPDGVSTIDSGAFMRCTSLSSVSFKGNVPKADGYYPIFQACNSLESINVSLEYLSNYATNSDFTRSITVSFIQSEYVTPTSGIGTFSTATAVTLPEGLRAYYCKNYNSTAGTIATKEITGAIPANTGVLLRGTAGETYTITASSETPEAISENALVAVTEATHVDQTDGDYTNFMMKGGKFIKIAASSNPDEKMPANRAYLQLPTASIANSLNIEIDWKEETGVRLIDPLLTSPRGGIYTLDGRKLNGIPAKGGVYINNGKKVIK